MEGRQVKIIGFKAENVKRIEVAEISPKGESVIVTGKNGNGKSSVLDSIMLAIQNTGSAKLRNGTSKGEVTVDLGDIVVQRRLTEKGSYISVTGKDGSKISSPQAALDKLKGDLALDPLDFTRKTTSDQREILLKAAGIDVAAIDKREKEAYDHRRDVKRDLASAENELKAHPEPEDAPDAPVDVDALIERQESAAAEMQQADQSERDLKRAVEDADNANLEVEELERKLEQARERAKACETLVEEKRKAIPDVVALRKQLQDITEQLRSASATNAAYEALTAHEEKKRLYDERKTAVDEAEKQLAAIRQERLDAIENADFGVPGLSVDENGITVDDVPYESLSSAVQLKIATTLAMAANPKIRVILIREGSFLDSDSMNAILDLAKEGDYQLWIEKVQDEAGETGVHMVEGRVAAIDGKPTAKPAPEPKPEDDEEEEFDLE